MLNGPRRIKHKKIKKGKLLKLEHKSNKLKFGSIGLKASESGIISYRQIEAARQAIVRRTKRKIKLWIRLSLDLPITLKSTGTRMGKGKGQLSHWGARVRGGTVLVEITGVNIGMIFAGLKTGGTKLPVKTKIFT